MHQSVWRLLINTVICFQLGLKTECLGNGYKRDLSITAACSRILKSRVTLGIHSMGKDVIWALWVLDSGIVHKQAYSEIPQSPQFYSSKLKLYTRSRRYSMLRDWELLLICLWLSRLKELNRLISWSKTIDACSFLRFNLYLTIELKAKARAALNY
jgi:hypothetical protein